MQIKVENTAITNGVSSSVKSFLHLMKEPILDYGAGKLRNSKFLVSEGYKVSVLDIEKQVKKWSDEDKELFEEVYKETPYQKEFYSTVLLTFVLNVIPDNEIRKTVLQSIHTALKKDGHILVEVRRDKGIMGSKHIEQYKDGYLLGSGQVKTFQKPYTKEEIVDLVSPYFTVEQVVVKSDSIILVGVK